MRRIVRAYGAGTLLGASASALVLAAAGALLWSVVPGRVIVAAGLVACLASLIERALVGARKLHPILPERRRLISSATLKDNGMAGVRTFGFLMGLGWWVYIPSAAPYCLAAACIMAWPGLLFLPGALSGFALGRWFPVALAARPATSNERVAMMRRLEHLSGTKFTSFAGVAVTLAGLLAVVS
jgi:hypothetical protein